jgi:Acyl-CoA dehydrogenase, C-terminal domain
MSQAGFVADALRTTAAQLFEGGDGLVPLDVLLDLGWAELAADDLETAVSVLAEEQGRRLGVSRLAELAMCAPAPALFDPADSALVFGVGPPRTFPDGSAFDGIVLADARSAATFIVPLSTNGRVALCRLPAAEVEAAPVGGIDPDARLTRVRGRVDGGVPVEPGAWEAAVAAGSLAIAHELLGVAQEMLDLAVAHVKERHQFGVPIGSFQAVQHRLADVLIDVTAGRAVCRTAWVDRDRFMSAAARAAAGRAFQTATVHCQQVLGAMGSTWEHPLHRYQRRGLLLDRLLDPAPTLRDALSAVVATQRRVEVLDR